MSLEMVSLQLITVWFGGAEIAGRENDRPNDRHETAGHEIAGHETGSEAANV